jgi:predicted aspartyl protease
MALRVLDVDPLGPLIQVGVRVGTAFAAAGLGRAPHSYSALIDTGASSTAISPQVVSDIRPQRTGTAPVGRAGATTTADVHDIGIKFEHHLLPGSWYELAVVEVTPATPGVDVLIGRDLLEHVTLLYAGPDKKLVITF